jgi:L-histidine Nalpha-methyltransferase
MAGMITEVIAQRSIANFAEDVRSGLTRPGQKELSANYLYDELGSALFNAITLLPEYGLFRADERLLQKHAEEIVRPLFPANVTVAELGSGSGKKTRWILEALTRHQHTTYFPIDVSPAALTQCANELGQLDRVSVYGIEREFLGGVARAVALRQPYERLLVLFVGSTIGNFHRGGAGQFLTELRQQLVHGDALLLGTDLVKPVEQMLAAYDDALGVTSAFNLNLLTRINRELGADFDLREFRHLARYDEAERRIEMHLVAQRDQTVTIPAAGCAVQFKSGETIWTESSYKFSSGEIFQMAERTGFRAHAQWVDEEWPFAETLLIAE